MIMFSDASRAWGCGAMHGDLWFQVEWPQDWSLVSIAPKELVPIVVASILWGPFWVGKRVCCLCDNMAVVAAVNKRAAKDPSLSTLLQILAFVSAILDMHVSARHLPGIKNNSADALPCNKLSSFFSLNPQASPMPSIIPPELRELVSTGQYIGHV